MIIDAEEKDSETCVEFSEEIPSEMEYLWHELSPLENTLVNQRMGIQTIQLNLSGDEEVVINDRYEEEVVEKLEILRKHSEEFVVEALYNFDINLYVNTRK